MYGRLELCNAYAAFVSLNEGWQPSLPHWVYGVVPQR
jgi:hypothetical protein